jgi:mRNA interferase MazF
MNVGHEMYGKGASFARPVLVFKKFSANTFFGIPMTSKEKNGSWYISVNFCEKKRLLVLNQARVFDARRLSKRMNTVSDREFVHVRAYFLKYFAS